MFADDVLGPTAAPETSSAKLPYTRCKNLKTENQYSFHGEILKSKTHFMFTNFLFSENRAVYEIMSKNMVEPDGPRITSQ